MKGNLQKCHLLMNFYGPATNHFETIAKKASQKIHVLARITLYMCISKRKLLIIAFFKAQCSYCPLVWIAIAVWWVIKLITTWRMP